MGRHHRLRGTRERCKSEGRLELDAVGPDSDRPVAERVGEGQFHRTKAQPAGMMVAVKDVAGDGASGCLEVESDLMGSTGGGVALDQGLAVADF